MIYLHATPEVILSLRDRRPDEFAQQLSLAAELIVQPTGVGREEILGKEGSASNRYNCTK